MAAVSEQPSVHASFCPNLPRAPGNTQLDIVLWGLRKIKLSTSATSLKSSVDKTKVTYHISNIRSTKALMRAIQKLKFPEVQSHRVAGDEGPATLQTYTTVT